MSVLHAQSALFLSVDDFDAERISLFGALNKNQLNDLCAYLELEQRKAGETVFSENEPPSSIYILLDGRIDCLSLCQGLPTLKASLAYGAAFGESAFIGIQPQFCSAKVNSDSRLLVLSREALMDLHKNDLELFAMLMMNLARELARKYHSAIKL
ncbi:cyclic nucleotide-binding domain-containing protein [Agaribacterium haliotis]|uniref:cyclic nucleotide-binding domain-containing protein n=1 Tax=Agaribacterium haliotis TaxID=2013869 RepID=UPI000BB55C45|nr:cyclic nucleotide-binding domain-containing protein [Agaribacterium haliotis]